VFKDFVSDIAAEMRMLGIPTRETAEKNDTLKPTAGSQIKNVQLQGR